jgi:hypothetical protein
MLLKLKIISMLALVLIALYILVIAYLYATSKFEPVMDLGKQSLLIFEAVLGLFAILAAVLGLNYSAVVKWTQTTNWDEGDLFPVHMVRVALFQSLAVFGVILALLGSYWFIFLPFFISSTVTLILSFPTKRRLNLWQREKFLP